MQENVVSKQEVLAATVEIKKECEISEHVIDSLARCLLPKIQAYYDSPEGQAAFVNWMQEHTKHT